MTALIIALAIVVAVWIAARKLRTRQGPVPPGSGTADPRPGGRPKPPVQ